MRKPTIEMRKGNDGKIYFHLKNQFGAIVLSSNAYRNNVEAIQGIDLLMRYGADPRRFLCSEDANGCFLFQLQTPSGRVIGRSIPYLSKQGRDNGMVAVHRAVQFGKVLDLN